MDLVVTFGQILFLRMKINLTDIITILNLNTFLLEVNIFVL